MRAGFLHARTAKMRVCWRERYPSPPACPYSTYVAPSIYADAEVQSIIIIVPRQNNSSVATSSIRIGIAAHGSDFVDMDSSNTERDRKCTDNGVGKSDQEAEKKKRSWSLLRRKKDGKLRLFRREKMSPLAATYLSEDQTAAVLVVNDDDSSSVSAENGNPDETEDTKGQGVRHLKNLAVILEEDEDRERDAKGEKFESNVEENQLSHDSLASVVVTASTEPETPGHTCHRIVDEDDQKMQGQIIPKGVSVGQQIDAGDITDTKTAKDHALGIVEAITPSPEPEKELQDFLQLGSDRFVYAELKGGSDVSSPIIWSPSDYVQELNAEDSDTTASLSSWRAQAVREHCGSNDRRLLSMPYSPPPVKRIWPIQAEHPIERSTDAVSLIVNDREHGNLPSPPSHSDAGRTVKDDPKLEAKSRLPNLLQENNSLKPSQLSALNPWMGMQL